MSSVLEQCLESTPIACTARRFWKQAEMRVLLSPSQ